MIIYIEGHKLSQPIKSKEPQAGKRILIRVDSITEIEEKAVGCVIKTDKGQNSVFESYEAVKDTIDKMNGYDRLLSR